MRYMSTYDQEDGNWCTRASSCACCLHIGIDFIGPLKYKSRQGNQYILTISDYFNKFTQAFACKDKEAVTVCDALFKVCSCIQSHVRNIAVVVMHVRSCKILCWFFYCSCLCNLAFLKWSPVTRAVNLTTKWIKS